MNFNKNIGLMLGTHEAHAMLAEAWFTFLGFVAVTAVFHAAAQKTDAVPLIALKWVCYFLLFNWVYYKICKLIWFIYPPADIVNGKPTNLVIGLSVWLSSTAMLGVYKLSFLLFEVFISAVS